MSTVIRNGQHGFVWPDGLPECVVCDRPANDPIHVTPARGGGASLLGLEQVADDRSTPHLPSRAHAYAMRSGLGVVTRIPCQVCAGTLSDARHPVGAPSGMISPGPIARLEPPTLAKEQAFVAEIGNRIVFAGRGSSDVDQALLPTDVLEQFRQRSAVDSGNVWIMGRYVEAERANRNAAFWSSGDLEFGAPSVAHGPINWLHEEKHIIGAIAASELVQVEREAADDGGVGNHIVALGAVWPAIYPNEVKAIQRASEKGSLWYSMECVSREVACLYDGCGNVPTYRAYMTERETARCDHMKQGAARRFVDPVFLGAGIIVPPVRPGWANADARVLMPQAAAMAERQAAAFEGMTTSDSELLVAQLMAFVE